MEFGLEIFANFTFKRGKPTHPQNLVSEINREIQELEQGKTYKLKKLSIKRHKIFSYFHKFINTIR